MAGEQLVQVGVGLTAVALAGATAHRFGQSVIPAYILAGVLVGPNEPTSLLGVPLTLVEHGEFVEVVAELGIVLLLFFLGLEFSPERLVEQPRRLLGVGTIDFAVNFGLGLALGVAFGLSAVATVFLAGVVYISSSAVITKSLVDRGWIADRESEVIFGTLVFEDVLIAVYLALLSALVLGGGSLSSAARSIGVAFAVLVALSAAAWYGTEWVERAFAIDHDELFLLRVMGVTTLVAGAALTAGVSEAVAAFFVGGAFSSTSLADRVERVVSPARDLFAAVFFFSVGLTTDLGEVWAFAVLVAVAAVVTGLGKLVSGTLSGRLWGLGPKRSLRAGVGLVARGEFSLVIAALAGTVGGDVGRVVPSFAVGYVLVMSVLGTVAITYADPLVERAAARLEPG
jgi:CPA2 family monovalent cation:H+ antiporter-2